MKSYSPVISVYKTKKGRSTTHLSIRIPNEYVAAVQLAMVDYPTRTKAFKAVIEAGMESLGIEVAPIPGE